MKKLTDLLLSTIIMWLPVLALVICNWLTQVITAEMIISFLKVIGLLAIIVITLCRKESKNEKLSKTIRR